MKEIIIIYIKGYTIGSSVFGIFFIFNNHQRLSTNY
jgi:hypothetical protein